MRRSLVMFTLCALLVGAPGEAVPGGRISRVSIAPWSEALAAAERLGRVGDRLVARASQRLAAELGKAHRPVQVEEPAYERLYALAEEVEVPVLLRTASDRFPARRRIRTTR